MASALCLLMILSILIHSYPQDLEYLTIVLYYAQWVPAYTYIFSYYVGLGLFPSHEARHNLHFKWTVTFPDRHIPFPQNALQIPMHKHIVFKQSVRSVCPLVCRYCRKDSVGPCLEFYFNQADSHKGCRIDLWFNIEGSLKEKVSLFEEIV